MGQRFLTNNILLNYILELICNIEYTDDRMTAFNTIW